MREKKHKMSVQKLIILCIVTTIITTTLTLSKFKSSAEVGDNTKVAYPILNLSAETSVIPVSISPAQSEHTYTFSVSNKETDKESQVSIEYTIQIESLENLPLEFELYTYDNEELGSENLFSGNVKVTDKIQIKINSDNTHTYQLKINWREGETSYLNSQTIDYIQIVVDSNQMD